MPAPDNSLNLVAAGNTDYLAVITLLEKGYDLTEKSSSSEYGAEAFKDGRLFAGSSWLQVLGLVALWEVRGDNWQLRDDEPQPDDVLEDLFGEHGER
jgi:hypothetical protein